MTKGVLIFIIGILIIGIGVLYFGEGDIVNTKDDEKSTVEDSDKISTDDVAESTQDVKDVSDTKDSESEVVTPPPPIKISENTPPPENLGVDASGDAIIVSYTNGGFIPPVVEVEAGKSVKFINGSSGSMRVTSEGHPTNEQNYPEFNQNRTVSPGGSFTFQFMKIGVWGYYNLSNDKHLGAVSVVKQEN